MLIRTIDDSKSNIFKLVTSDKINLSFMFTVNRLLIRSYTISDKLFNVYSFNYEPLIIYVSISYFDFPLKGGLPQSKKKVTTPNDQISDLSDSWLVNASGEL